MIAEALAFCAAAAGVAAAPALRPARLPRPRVLVPAGPRARIATVLAAGVVGTLVAAPLPGRLSVLLAVAAAIGGLLAPDVWLARRRSMRAAAVRRDMPALLDLLGVAVEAGLSLQRALAEVGRRSRSPLACTWGGIAAQVAVGVPLADALEAHRREMRLPEIDAFVGSLARAARHGAPIADTLAAQAREARLARRRAIQAEAARAGPKMQLVVALLLVPSVMLLVAAALVAALTEGGAAQGLGGF